MPYVVFRHMGPHFDSYANSGIPEITGTAHQPFSGRGKEKRPDLLHLLPHLRPNDVGSNALSRIRDLQQLATAILGKKVRDDDLPPTPTTPLRIGCPNLTPDCSNRRDNCSATGRRISSTSYAKRTSQTLSWIEVIHPQLKIIWDIWRRHLFSPERISGAPSGEWNQDGATGS